MLDHLMLNVGDVAASRRFYEAALAPLGVGVVRTFDERNMVGFGVDGKPSFWLSERAPVGGSFHVAFAADSRTAVDAFYAAGLAAGGRDNGGPGPRPHYHPGYYGAFLLDPDGNNIEAVRHTAG
jgi:catechol 2,3-dioxygenase-like lactoylglutathione lyase family enzyme